MNNKIWDEIYELGHEQKYPWDSVVSFIYRNTPPNTNKKDIKILEVGFGTASNLWFAARENYDVSGVEGSVAAVDIAKRRFDLDGLSGDLRVGDFTSLPFDDEVFDFVIDRAALTCAGKSEQKKAIKEIHRSLKSGGKFFYNCYADTHSSFRSGSAGPDDVRVNITEGTATGVGQIFFSSRRDIDEFFLDGWILRQVKRRELTDMLNPLGDIHAEWLVVAEKK